MVLDRSAEFEQHPLEFFNSQDFGTRGEEDSVRDGDTGAGYKHNQEREEERSRPELPALLTSESSYLILYLNIWMVMVCL